MQLNKPEAQLVSSLRDGKHDGVDNSINIKVVWTEADLFRQGVKMRRCNKLYRLKCSFIALFVKKALFR